MCHIIKKNSDRPPPLHPRCVFVVTPLHSAPSRAPCRPLPNLRRSVYLRACVCYLATHSPTGIDHPLFSLSLPPLIKHLSCHRRVTTPSLPPFLRPCLPSFPSAAARRGGLHARKEQQMTSKTNAPQPARSLTAGVRGEGAGGSGKSAVRGKKGAKYHPTKNNATKNTLFQTAKRPL